MLFPFHGLRGSYRQDPSTSTSPWNTLTMITQPKCIRAADGISIFRQDVATIAKPNTLKEEEQRKEETFSMHGRKCSYVSHAISSGVTDLFAANFWQMNPPGIWVTMYPQKNEPWIIPTVSGSQSNWAFCWDRQEDNQMRWLRVSMSFVTESHKPSKQDN